MERYKRKFNEDVNIIQQDIDYIFKEIKNKKGIDNLTRVDKKLLFNIGQEVSFSFPSETSSLRPNEIQIKKALENLKSNKNWNLTKNQLKIAIDYYNYN